MARSPMVGAKERGKDMQSTFSASLGKSRARKFIFGGVLVAALTATGFTQAPSTPTASSAIVSANTKDIGNLKKEKQQQIEYFLVNEGLQKVNILFLTTLEDIGRWKEALDKYFSERSSHTINITVSSPKGGEEGLNNEKLLYYNVIMEKMAKKTTENAAIPSIVPAASNPVKAAIPPVPVNAKTDEKKSEAKALGSIVGIKPEVKAEIKVEQVKTEPIIKEIKVSSDTAKKEEPKMAGIGEKKPEVKKEEPKIEQKNPEAKAEEVKIAGVEVKKEEIVAKVPEIKAPEVKVPEIKAPPAPVIKELSPEELVRYDACINKFEIMYNRTSYNTFKDIAEFMRKNVKQKPDILKTIDDVENYFKSQASTIYKGPSEVETLKQMIEMTVGPLQ